MCCDYLDLTPPTHSWGAIIASFLDGRMPHHMLESSWRQGLAKAAGKASAAPASLDELRAVDARLKRVSSRRSSLSISSIRSGSSESDDIPRQQLQPSSSASSARHSQPKLWSHLVREQVLQPDHTQGSLACPAQRAHARAGQAAAVAVGTPRGSGGWPARKAGVLSRNSSKSGRPVASSALDLLD